MDESLRPQYKALYALSLNEFKRWQEMADAWGLASVHEQRAPLVQKMYFEQITEKEFFENCNLDGTCVTFQHYVEESVLVYNKRVSIFLRRSEFMEATRSENEAYLSYYNQLRKLAEMADIRTMREKEWIMHMVMISLPTNVVKQVTMMTINPKLEDVLGTLEVVEQQMRQLNNTNFPLPPDRSAKKKKTLSANVASEETTRGRDRGGGGGNRGRGRGRGAGGNARGGGQTNSYIDYSMLGCFRCGEDHYRDQCTKMPSDCKCSYCNQTGHVEKVCLSKRRATANVSEETPTTEEKKEDKRNQTPPNGAQDFSCPRQANLITVKYLDEKDVHHTSALSSYELCNEAESVKGRLRRLACMIERKKGGGNAQIAAVCDPGATASLLSLSRAEELDCQQREAEGIVISTANGASLDIHSQCEIWLNTKSGKRRLVHVFICADLSQDMLVSVDDCEALGLLPKGWPNHEEEQVNNTYSKRYQANSVVAAQSEENDGRVDLTDLQQRLWSDTGDISCIPAFNQLPETLQMLIKSYKDVFSDSIGDRPMDVTPVKLTVDETVPKPPKTMTCRAIPLHWQSAGERILTDLLQAGIVKRVTEPCPFVSPSFFVKKGDGLGDPRFVIDYKGTLNPALVRVPHPLPSPMQVWARVKPGSTHFLSCDLKQAFWQLPLEESCQSLTSFMSTMGILCWKRLPMGISIAPETFNREVDIALSKNPNLTNCVREVDDLLLFASSQEELEEQFCELLKTCRGARMTLAPKKIYYAPPGQVSKVCGDEDFLGGGADE